MPTDLPLAAYGRAIISLMFKEFPASGPDAPAATGRIDRHVSADRLRDVGLLDGRPIRPRDPYLD